MGDRWGVTWVVGRYCDFGGGELWVIVLLTT